MKEHFDIKETGFCEVSQKETVEKIRVKNILEAFEYIVDLAKDSNLASDFYRCQSTVPSARTIRIKPPITLFDLRGQAA